MNYPTTIKNLIDCYKKLPGIGAKTAERLALASMEMDQDAIDLFSKSLVDIKTKIKHCTICNNLSETEKCLICTDNMRNKSIVCVVEDPKNIIAIEKIGTYNGTYHVLNGLISPLDGINPEDVNISTLLDRIDKENIKEVILALKPNIEGETTALYINRKLKDKNVVVTKIAHGIPLGADMEYIDTLTLSMALDDRKKIS
jgi:recombination protein RecR